MPVIEITEYNFYYRNCKEKYSFDSPSELIEYITTQLIPNTYAVKTDWWGELLPRSFKLSAYMPNSKTLGGRWQSDATSSSFSLDGKQHSRDMKDFTHWAKRHNLI